MNNIQLLWLLSLVALLGNASFTLNGIVQWSWFDKGHPNQAYVSTANHNFLVDMVYARALIDAVLA